MDGRLIGGAGSLQLCGASLVDFLHSRRVQVSMLTDVSLHRGRHSLLTARLVGNAQRSGAAERQA